MTDTRVHVSRVRPGDWLLDNDGERWGVIRHGTDLHVAKAVGGGHHPIVTDDAGFLMGLKRPPLENADG